jgi:hypothetical protein
MLAIAYALSTFSAITILTSYSAYAQLLQLRNISNSTICLRYVQLLMNKF